MIYLFDFDGVLIDSVKEAALSAYNAVTKGNLTSYDEAPKKCMQLFYNNRFIYYRPAMLYLLMQWCIENFEQRPDHILSREEFAQYVARDSRSASSLGDYFYSVRNSFMELEPEKWLTINIPFSSIWEHLICRGAEKVVILTAKNRKAVLKLTHHYGLKIKEENIYSGDNSQTKIDNFKKIKNRFPGQKFYFVDDHLVNLIDMDQYFNKPADKVLSFGLANWGYGWEGDCIEAEKLGYDVLGQEDLIKKIGFR